VTVVSLPARGRPPEAAARRAGLESVEKVVTAWICSSSLQASPPVGPLAAERRTTVKRSWKSCTSGSAP
jgi:hypothetical protein